MTRKVECTIKDEEIIRIPLPVSRAMPIDINIKHYVRGRLIDSGFKLALSFSGEVKPLTGKIKSWRDSVSMQTSFVQFLDGEQ